MPPKRRAIAQRGLIAHEQLRAVATGRCSRILLTGIGDMPLECLAGDGRQPPKEGVVRRRHGEGRGETARHIEALRLTAEKFGLALERPVFAGADRRRKATSAQQQTGRKVAVVGVQQVPRRHFVSGAKNFFLAEEHMPVFGLPGDAEIAAPGMGKKPQRRGHPDGASGFGAGQEQVGSQKNLSPG
jgi:hypothetical protein